MKTENTESVRDVLEELARKNNGQITPQIVLREAERKKSPLHTYFCWDDTEAANAWRLNQAAVLIRRVRVTIETSPEKSVNVRAFFNVTPNAEPGETEDGEPEQPAACYVPVRVAMTEYREQVLSRAVSELRSVKGKYSHLTELASVWDAIEKV